MEDRSISTHHHDSTSRTRRTSWAHRDRTIATIPVPGGFRNPLAPAVAPTAPTLLPLMAVDADVTPALERMFRPLAIRAQAGDWAARDALYRAFEPKLLRSAGKITVPFAPYGAQATWERADVTQQAYLVFVEIIANWSPEIPFGRYTLAHFPWRLRDAVYRGFGKPTIPTRTFERTPFTDDLAADPTVVIALEEATIAAIADSFEQPFAEVIRLHVLQGLSISDTAERMGVSRRTVTRHWRSILINLRRTSPIGQ